jgi:hypothetical protein
MSALCGCGGFFLRCVCHRKRQCVVARVAVCSCGAVCLYVRVCVWCVYVAVRIAVSGSVWSVCVAVCCSDAVLALLCACRRPRCALLCVYSMSRLSDIACPIRLSLAVCSCSVVDVYRALVARAWHRCVSRCDVRDRRSVTALSSGMTASGTIAVRCLVVSFWGSLAHGVLRER